MMPRVEMTPDLSFSRLIYGMWRLADDENTTPQHVEAKIEACLSQGITTFDQADIYGGYTAEGVMGAALRANPSLRAQMEIVSKCDIVAPVGRYADASVKYYDTSRSHILSSVDLSLREMGIEHLDLLLIHRPDPLMDHHETGTALDEVVKSGKVRSVGVSNFRPWDWELLQSAMQTPLVTNQIEVSLAAVAPFTNGDVAFHQKNANPIMAWSPLGGGTLMFENGALQQRMRAVAEEFDVDTSAVAIAFLLHHPAQILPVLGTNNLARIASISDALRVKLDRPMWFSLYEAALGHEVP